MVKTIQERNVQIRLNLILYFILLYRYIRGGLDGLPRANACLGRLFRIRGTDLFTRRVSRDPAKLNRARVRCTATRWDSILRHDIRGGIVVIRM